MNVWVIMEVIRCGMGRAVALESIWTTKDAARNHIKGLKMR